MEEAVDISGRYQTLIIVSVSSRSRAVRSRQVLGWRLTRPNMLEEIGLPLFRELACNPRELNQNPAGSQGRGASTLVR